MKFDAKEFLQLLFGTHVSEDLAPEWAEEYEERAGILEFDGGLTQRRAETQADQEIRTRIRNLEETETFHLQSTREGI